MSHKNEDHGKNNFDKNRYNGIQDEKRVDQLIDLVEKHSRTERHLEEHSDIADPEAIRHTEDIQREREKEIENLKEVIAHGKNVNVDDLSNLQRNYEFTDRYLEENANHIDHKTLKRTLEKQENRKGQLDNMS